MNILKKTWSFIIKPTSLAEDIGRKELILNVILTFLIGATTFVCLSTIYVYIFGFEKTALSIGPFFLLTFFLFMLVLSKKGHADLASWIFVGLYFLVTTYDIYAREVITPISLISYGAMIITSSLILGMKSGMIISGLIVFILISLSFTAIQTKEIIESIFILGLITMASWLSTREIEKSLKRARASEKTLKAECDLLEIKMEEKTKELKTMEIERMAELYRFVEFGRLSSGIFHDLLNPLSVVSLSVEKLGCCDKSDQKQTLECINKAIQASKRMESFMRTAKKQIGSKGKNQIFSVEKEMRDAIDLLVHKSKNANVEIHFSSPPDVNLFGNPVRFFQAAVNIICNAIDSYSKTSEKETKTVEVNITNHPLEVRVSVKDFGCGIKKEIQKTIFDPFVTTKHDRPERECGFGLGLSMTKNIMEKDFKGRIELVSAEGKGSEFVLVFPLSTIKLLPDAKEGVRVRGNT